MNNNFWNWFAGFVDGDGCFTISLTTSRGKCGGIIISPQIRIGLKGNDKWILQEIQKLSNAGKIYYSNKGKINEVCVWQTTNLNDTLKIAKKLEPYLRLKKEKAKIFIQIVERHKQTMISINGKRIKNVRLKKQKDVKYIVKHAITLNYDRQTKRYRDLKGWNYWKPLIEDWYPN